MTRLAVKDRSLDKRVKKSLKTALAGSRPAVRELTHRQVTECLSTLLDIDLTHLATAAWRTCDDLVEAAERTHREPGSRAVVDIAQQHYDARREATLDISLDGQRVSALPVRLDIGLDLTGLRAVVVNGCITEIDGGTGKLTATLSLDAVALPPASKPLDLPFEVQVKPPVSLLRPSPVAPASAVPPPPLEIRLPAGTSAGQPVTEMPQIGAAHPPVEG